MKKKQIRPHISEGNRKMGDIPSWSLPSGKTCSPEACKYCFKNCYAQRIERRLANVRNAYAENLEMLETDPARVFRKIDNYMRDMDPPRRFRAHVSGDFYSCEYLLMWVTLSQRNPKVKILAFTKQFAILKEALTDLEERGVKWPKNLIIVCSAWPGMELPGWVAENFPVAYMQDGTEDRIPEGAYLCEGDCSGKCSGHCWEMKPGQAVVFKKH